MPREQEDEREDDDQSKTSQHTKLVTPALAGLTTLLAASPILSVSPGKEGEENIEDQGHQRKCIRIPDDDGVIIPLHGDSDEEINPERYKDPSLVVVQKTVEQDVEKPKIKKKGKAPKTPKSKSDDGTSTQKLVTPTLAGLATVIAATPIISEPTETPKPPKPDSEVRTFIKNPKDGTVIVPLHGDSDEEIHPERYEDPSLLAKQRIEGPVIEEYVRPTTPGGTSRDEGLEEEESSLIEMPCESKLAASPMTKTISKNSFATEKSKKGSPKMVTEMLVGMSTLLAASPILSSSPEKEMGEEEQGTDEVHERKFIRIPNEEAVIIPLHGDSDEEINPERYEDPTLQGVQKIGDVVEEIKPVKVKTVESKPSNTDNKSSAAKLVTPMLAGLTTLLAASPILSVSPEKDQEESEEQKIEDVHERKFIRIPNEQAIIIPLHGDSDEEINPERYEDPALQGVQKIGEVVEEIKPVMKTTKHEGSQSSKSGDSGKKLSSTAKLVTPMLAGLTTLLAASPILSVSPEKKEEGELPKTEEVHERKFIRIQNEEAIIIPLHGDSDEDINPDRYEDPTLQGVQKIGDVVEDIKPIKVGKDETSKLVKGTKENKAVDSSISKLTAIPTLAGMATLLVASPILGTGEDHGDDADDEKSDVESKEEVRERKFIRIPNQDGVIIPLHGDSDEEINPQRYEDPSLQGFQKIGDVVEDFSLKQVKAKKDSEAAKKDTEDLNSAKLVTPMLAGMTTLLASSPILTVSPGKDAVESDVAGDEDKPIERKVIKMPGGEGVIVPLHGDSDEELHPDRYEDPSLVGIQKIEGPTFEEIKAPQPKPAESKTKVLKTAKVKALAATEKATREAAKLVTPMLAGMTTLLASSPLLTSPKKSEFPDEEMIKNLEQTGIKSEDTIERIPNQQSAIIPLHGDSDEDLHSNRNENPDLQSTNSITGSTEESIAPIKPDRFKEEKNQPESFEKAPISADPAEEPISESKTEKISPIQPEFIPEIASNNVLLSVRAKDATEVLAEYPLKEASESEKAPRESKKESDSTVHSTKEPDDGHVLVSEVASVATKGTIGVAAGPTKNEAELGNAPKKAKRTKAKAPKQPPKSTSEPVSTDVPPTAEPAAHALPSPTPESLPEVTETNRKEVEHQNNKEVHPARDHEYEPVNPKEPPPSPPVGTRQSRADQAERGAKVDATPTASALVSTPTPAPVQIASAPNPPDQADAPPSKLVTPFIEDTTLSAASHDLTVTPQEEDKKDEVFERKFIKIPNENAIIIPLHGDSDEELHPERYKDPSLQGVQRIEGPVVEELKPPPPQATAIEEIKPPPKIKSILHVKPTEQPNISVVQVKPTEQPNISVLQVKPTEQPNLSVLQVKPTEQPNLSQSEYELVEHPDDMVLDEAQPLSFQDRFKAGAGEIRDKFRNMNVPKISLPDRPKISFPDTSKMKLPERPQFLKERPQFLKERPQFLKERPQFLKEKPQFLKEKPQFLKEKPKFLTQKPKFLTERPRFNLPDRSKFKVPERFKFEKAQKVDKPKIRKPNPSSLRRPLRDAITISSESSHNLFQTLKARTYPRFMSKKKREREQAAQLRAAGTSIETESSPPSPPVSSRLFPDRYRDIKFADEEAGYADHDQRMDVQSEEGYEENTAPFHERYERSTPYITTQGPDDTMKAKIDSSSDIAESDKEQISSGASSMRHRGVLEEIDSDEFFLRQKGLSREDVDVSRYLSKEIREAFRSPRNVLAHMDSADSRYTDEYEGAESPDLRYRDEPPEPPGRSKNRSESRESDFNTFPIKPTRRKHSEGDFGSKEIFEKVRKPPRKYRSKSDTRQGSSRSLDRTSARNILFDDTPQPPSRQKSLRSLTRSRPESATDVRGGSVRRDVAHDEVMAPARPLRKSRSRGASVDERTSRGADSLSHDYGEYEQEEEEDRIEMEEEELEEELEEEVPEQKVHEHVQVFRTMPVVFDAPVRSAAMDDEDIPGYATVRKPKPPRPPIPPKSKKEQLQSQLHSIKAQGINFFQTFPRRAMKSLNKPRLPTRPLKNYSAGPVRPPRRNRVFREPVYIDGDLPDTQAGGEDTKSYDLKHEYEETRDLQRGEIVERMKGRPLPPPPRPPRRSKDDDSFQSGLDQQEEDICEPEEDICEPEEDICEPEEDVCEPEEELPAIPQKPSRREEFLASLIVDVSSTPRHTREERSQIGASHTHPTAESSQQTSFDMADISVSIQTDPLPEGFIVDDRSEGYGRSRSRTTESSVASKVGSEPHRPVDETMQRIGVLSLHDPRRLFDPEVIQASEETEEAPPPLPHRNIPPIPITIPPITIPEIPPLQVSFPDRLHLAQLDVDKLNVNEIQANSIKVSDIDGVTMQISEIAATSGNLVLNGIELPPDFIKNLVAQIPVPEPQKPIVIEKVIEKPVVVEKVIERVRETTPQPHLKRILTPPPPIVVQHSAQSAEEVPSPPIHQASTVEQLPKPVTTRTRRTSPTRVVDDSEGELASIITERKRREREQLEKEPKPEEPKPEETKPAQQGVPRTEQDAPKTTPIISEEEPLEPSALALIKQLLSIWYRNIVSGTGSLVNGINSMFPENDKRRDAQTAAVILIVIIAALILLGLGADSSVHHHHWDYLNPPR